MNGSGARANRPLIDGARAEIVDKTLLCRTARG
jgi:hypothetical protein